MEILSKNEIITLEYLADGKQHDEAPSTLSDAQFYTALKSLKSKGMVYAAFCEGETVFACQIKKAGQAALDDLVEDNPTPEENNDGLTIEELKVIEFLSDGKEHFDEPEIDDYYEICEYLSDLKLVNLGETKDEGIKLTYKGKRKWEQHKREKEESMGELEFLILNILRLRGKEINPQIKPSTQVYDFEELSLYTKDEITECSLRMQDKGWIICFVDNGPAYWHELKDKGLIALRNYIKKHPDTLSHGEGHSIDEQGQSIDNSSKSESGLPLPKLINTERAQTYFQKAIDKGLLKFEKGKFSWITIGNRGGNSQLAYFCGKVFEYRNSISGNAGTEFPEEELNKLFQITRMYSLLTQVYKAQRKQPWRRKIDELFE